MTSAPELHEPANLSEAVAARLRLLRSGHQHRLAVFGRFDVMTRGLKWRSHARLLNVCFRFLHELEAAEGSGQDAQRRSALASSAPMALASLAWRYDGHLTEN